MSEALNPGLAEGLQLLQRGAFAEAEAVLLGVERAGPGDPRLATALAIAAFEQGRHAEAEARWRAARQAHPTALGPVLDLAHALLRLGRVADAATEFRCALELTPALPIALRGLAACGIELADWVGAEQTLRVALRAAPRDHLLWLSLARVLRERMLPTEALAAVERAHALAPGAVPVREQRALLLADHGRLAEAEAVWLEAIAETADARSQARLHARLAQLLVQAARADDARRHAALAIARAPRAVPPRATLALLDRGDDANLIALRDLAADPTLDDESRATADLALARADDAAGAHATAFSHAARGKSLRRKRLPRFDGDALLRFVGDVEAHHDRATLERLGAHGDPGFAPIAVVGMPRSGTSLVAQILDSHPLLHSVGESPALVDAANLSVALAAVGAPGGRAAYPRAVAELAPADITTLAHEMRQRLEASVLHGAGDSGARIVTKLPGDHRHLGLLAALFPRAQVVHCVRDPLDTCLSIFMNDLSGGDPAHCDLDDLAATYAAYRRLMAHWQRVLPIPILAVHYERLVAAPEAGARALVEFAGLGWDPACAAPERNLRGARTASALQVTRPIDQGSVGRWHHYRSELEPLRTALRREGVEVER